MGSDFLCLPFVVEAVQALGNKLLEELKQSDPGEGRHTWLYYIPCLI